MHVASAYLGLELIIKGTGSRAGVPLAVAWEAQISLVLLAEYTPVSPHLCSFPQLAVEKNCPTHTRSSKWDPSLCVPWLRADVWDRQL